MNSCTLTFKKKILISFFLILANLVILDIGLYFIAKTKSTKTTFINNKFSKINHLSLNNPKDKDIIFIGSSRTFYHVSTNVFKDNAINIYNFGISGAQFEDFPTLLPYINTINPKKLVISLPAYRFYYKLDISKYPTLDEIAYYYDIDKIKFLQSLEQWLINRHLFLNYSENIYYKFKSMYEKFDVNPKFNPLKNSNKLSIDKSRDYSKLVDCKVFDIKQTSDTQITLKCTNGDGVLIGSDIKQLNNATKVLKKFNTQAVKYLQKIINNIDKRDTKVYIVLEPMLHGNYKYNLDAIKKEFINTQVIDLTNLKIQDNFWSDNHHLNYKGREEYSKYLFKILK